MVDIENGVKKWMLNKFGAICFNPPVDYYLVQCKSLLLAVKKNLQEVSVGTR